MVTRKRTRAEVDNGEQQQQQQQQQQKRSEKQPEKQPKEEEKGEQQPGLLQQLRNSWEFANLMQYIHFFGRIMKIDDDLDIEVCISFFLLKMWLVLPG